MTSFAGNVLEVISNSDEHLMLMSERAKSLTKEQSSTIEKYCRIVSIPIQNIEDSAGGSVRCMIAEIVALPKK